MTKFVILFLPSAITTVELLICIKFGTELFAKTELRNVALWLLFQVRYSVFSEDALLLIKLVSVLGNVFY